MFQLIDHHHTYCIKNYMDSYLWNKPPDCILYSKDGTQFKLHKELFGQTKFMRKLLKSSHCCDTIEMIFPCSGKELAKLVDFIIEGKIRNR